MKIIDKLNEIHGKVVKRFVILGFPIFSICMCAVFPFSE